MSPVTVSKDEARSRILRYLADGTRAEASAIAYHVWPDANWWAPQGATFAAAEALAAMQKDGLADVKNKRWFLTTKGLLAAKVMT